LLGSDWRQAPTKLSFDLLKKRKEAPAAPTHHQEDGFSDKTSEQESDYGEQGHIGEATFQSIPGADHPEASMASTSSRIARGRGRGGSTRGGRAAQQARQREKMMSFCLGLIETLEIKYREEQASFLSTISRRPD
jgi:hypothetical protein